MTTRLNIQISSNVEEPGDNESQSQVVTGIACVACRMFFLELAHLRL